MPEPLAFDVFWSMRSPYCYFSLDRLLEIRRDWDVSVNLRVVYPVAIRNPGFFRTAPKHYRPYHVLDSQRVADFLGIPYRRPVPDPIIQDMETNEIAAEQPHIRRLTRLAAAAGAEGKALEFQDQVMRLLWDGRTDNWNEGTHLADAIERAGLDAQALMSAVDADPKRFDALIEANQEAQAEAGHGGVPLFVFKGEPFFGQDRLDMLLWRMQQHGLKRR
jgi:2-hydroxychromene-2-carboxylate isomerase